MVLPILSLPAELQAFFLLLLDDERTAGRLAQASREFKQRLPQQRLLQIREARRLAEQAQMEARRQRKRAAVLGHFEAVDGVHICKVRSRFSPFGSKCGQCFRVPPSGQLAEIMSHMRHHHPAEYGALIMLLEQM
jgi:hypothetical protein